MPHYLPSLPYAYDALEPAIDARTMELHHSKHHASYVRHLNGLLEHHPSFQTVPLEKLITDISVMPEDIRQGVRNHGGGHLNHSLFWQTLSPPGDHGGGRPHGELAEAIRQRFGSFEGFVTEFSATAMARFGSGWAWLCIDHRGQLVVLSTPNQDSPLMQAYWPILGLDVWEHAYYLRYQNRRADYIKAWWAVVNWWAVGELLARYVHGRSDRGSMYHI